MRYQQRSIPAQFALVLRVFTVTYYHYFSSYLFLLLDFKILEFFFAVRMQGRNSTGHVQAYDHIQGYANNTTSHNQYIQQQPQTQTQSQSQQQQHYVNDKFPQKSTVSKGKYTLQDFQIMRTLGTGSFGRVHLVRSVHNGRYYAIKVLKKAQVVRMLSLIHI